MRQRAPCLASISYPWYLILAFAGWVIAAPAVAGSYDIRYMTPAVTAALANRQARYDALARAKASGAVGEDNQGHVARVTGGSDAADIIAAENSDREVIYRAIVEQNQLPAEALTTVRHVFAEVQRTKAVPGDRVQLPSGEWAQK